MINYHNLKKCMYTSGDNHSDMIGIKSFLNFHHAVKVSDISSGYNFCTKTQTALAQFQNYKGLTSTGRMNTETWQAIGEETGAAQFEASFGNSPNIKVLRNMAFSKKIQMMFLTKIHTLLVQYAFQEGIGNGGLSASEVSYIDYGSKLTDTYFGTGTLFDIPVTLLIREAYKHAMTPEGMTVEEAIKKSHEWIKENTSKAQEIQQAVDVARADFDEQRKENPEMGRLQRVPVSGEMQSTALTAFGKACHTYMDSVSPAHHGWKKYEIPKTVDEKGVKNNIPLFILEAILHGMEESGDPTTEQRDQAISYMRGAFLTTFGDKWFHRAIIGEAEREKTYSFLKSKGLTWNENLVDGSSKKMPEISSINKGVGAIHYS